MPSVEYVMPMCVSLNAIIFDLRDVCSVYNVFFQQ